MKNKHIRFLLTLLVSLPICCGLVYIATARTTVKREFGLLELVLVIASSIALAWSSTRKRRQKGFHDWESWKDQQHERAEYRSQFMNVLFVLLAVGFVLAAIADWMLDFDPNSDGGMYILFAGIAIVFLGVNVGVSKLIKKK